MPVGRYFSTFNKSSGGFKMSNQLDSYSYWLDTRPFISRVVSGAVMMFIGDAAAQCIVEKRKWNHAEEKYRYDTKRAIRFTIMGLTISQPQMYVWLMKVQPRIMAQPFIANKSPFAVSLYGMLCDQTVWSISFNMFFMYTVSFVEHFNHQKAVSNSVDNIWDVQMTNYQIWPFVVAGNLYFTPLKYRTLVVNFCFIWWNMYLSWKNESAKHIETPVEIEATKTLVKE